LNPATDSGKRRCRPVLRGNDVQEIEELKRQGLRASGDLTFARRNLLVGVQIYRVLGVIFLVLFIGGQIPAVVALPTGAVDVVVGLLAPIIARASCVGSAD
jgi:hypothetical protein